MKKIITILISLISVFIGISIGYFLFNDKTDEINNANKIDDNPTKISGNLLENIEGVWIYCEGKNNYGCYGGIIEEEKAQYTYNLFQVATGGTPAGVIKNVINKENNQYEIEVYNAAYDSPMSSGEERTSYYNIDINNIKNNQITIGDKIYDYISKKYDYEQIAAYINKKING